MDSERNEKTGPTARPQRDAPALKSFEKWVRSVVPASLVRWVRTLVPKPLFQLWQHDQLAVLGVGSALVAFILWAWPIEGEGAWVGFWLFGNIGIGSLPLMFSPDRLPFIVAFVVLGAFLLLLRR